MNALTSCFWTSLLSYIMLSESSELNESLMILHHTFTYSFALFFFFPLVTSSELSSPNVYSVIDLHTSKLQIEFTFFCSCFLIMPIRNYLVMLTYDDSSFFFFFFLFVPLPDCESLMLCNCWTRSSLPLKCTITIFCCKSVRHIMFWRLIIGLICNYIMLYMYIYTTNTNDRSNDRSTSTS